MNFGLSLVVYFFYAYAILYLRVRHSSIASDQQPASQKAVAARVGAGELRVWRERLRK